MIKYTFIAILAFTAQIVQAQNFDDTFNIYEDDTTVEAEKPRVRKYPARLWEISGNGLKQPSYLYGTMHVSKKLAFNLGDTFYKALQSVDVVALELAIDSWLNNIGRNKVEYNFGFSRFGYGYNAYEGFYKTALNFEGSSLEGLLSELRSEDYMSNFLLYRQGYQSPDFSEKTYVDLYIHQVGKKLNKFCTGLEDFEISRRMVSRSEWRDRTMPRERRYGGSYDYYGYGEDPTEKAYREGDLDMIDSMEKKGADVHFLKWMLYERNKVMADRIEAITKTKRLFAAVGCAHLPGDSGVIEFLRRKGFTVTPIYDNVGDYAFKQKQKLEATTSPVSVKKYYSQNGELSFELPGIPLDRSVGTTEDIFYADVSNGAYYVLKKMPYYGKVKDISQEKLLKQLDSALYENIPGDITARAKTNINGFPALDVSNRTKTGETQRHVYIIMPDYVWYIKLNAPGNYAEGKEARDFFKSISVQPIKSKWNFYEPDCGGYRVYWPAPVVSNRVSFDTSTNFKGHIPLEYTDGNKNFYFIKSINVPYYGYDADTFHMHQIASNFAFYNKGKLERAEFRNIDGHTAMEFTIKFQKKDQYLHLLMAADGDVYYSLGAFTSDKRAPEGFLEKFSFTPYKYKYYPVRKKDPLSGVTYSRPSWTEIEGYHKIREEEKEIAHKEITYPESSRYGYSELSEYFKDTLLGDYSYISPISFPTGESVSLSMSKTMLIAPESNWKPFERQGIIKGGKVVQTRLKFFTDSLERRIDSLHKKYNKATYHVSSKPDRIKDTMFIENDLLVLEKITQHKGTSWLEYNKMVVGRDVVYTISTRYDRNRSMSSVVKNVVQSVEFENPKLHKMDSTKFGELMVKLLSSSDSIDIFRAADYRYFYDRIPKSFNDTLLGLMKKLDKNKLYGKGFASKIEKKLRADNYKPLIGYYMDKYRRGGDTSEIQAAMLGNLGELKNKEALDSLLYWLLEETPLAPENSYNRQVYSSIINTAYDSLKLWKEMYKKLLPLTRYEEYEDAIMALGITMLDSGFVDSSVFSGMIGDLTLSFRDDLKRKLSKAANDGGYSYSYSSSSYNSYSSYSDPDNYEYGSAGNTLYYSYGNGSFDPASYAIYGSDYGDERSEDYMNDVAKSTATQSFGPVYEAPAMEDYSYSRGSNTLYDKAKILVRFYHQDPDVAKRMTRIYKMQDKAEKMQFINLFLKHKIAMPDTMYRHYLKEKDCQYGFVQMLKKNKATDSIPKGYFEEKNMTTAFMYYHHFEKKDTVVFLGKKSAPIESENGNMYFFKHRNKEDKTAVKGEETWYYSYVWIGERDTLNTMKAPRYFQFNTELPKKQSIKDLMNMEVSRLAYWRHPLWQPLVPEDATRRRGYNYDYRY